MPQQAIRKDGGISGNRTGLAVSHFTSNPKTPIVQPVQLILNKLARK